MSGWLWSDPKKVQKQLARKADKECNAVLELRKMLLQGDEGQRAGQQLVQGGELESADDMTSDLYLRKWLFAREWDVPLTYKCIVSHASWRVHHMPEGYINEAWIQELLADEKACLQGCDSQGRGFAVIRVARHLPRQSIKADKFYICYVMNAMMAICDKQRNPRSRLVSMFDMTGCSMANMDVACMRMVLGLLNQHYVETLDQLLFYNPPLVFWGVWNTCKGLLPEVTRSKIRVIDPSDLAELRATVPPEVLPKEYGGQAELLLIQDAVRRFKLPPYPNLPELLAAGGGGSEAPPDLEPADMAAQIKDEAAAPAGKQQAQAAVAVAASASGRVAG